MSNYNFGISFRLWHPIKSAEELLSRFKLTPEFSHTVGMQRYTPKGVLLEGVYRETYCCFRMDKRCNDRLDIRIRHWCDFLSTQATYLDELNKSGGKAEFYISIFLTGDAGFEIDNADLERIQKIGLGLSIEMYSHQKIE